MPQFFITPDTIAGDRVQLDPKNSRHLVKALRNKKGDTVWLSDGQFRYRAVLEVAHPTQAQLRLVEKHRPILKAPAPVLGIALLKQDHLEWVLQKGVELGVHEFWLFESERTISHFKLEVLRNKMARLEKILMAAAKQSGLVEPTQLHPPCAFVQLTEHFNNFTAVVLAWEQEKERSFHSIFQTIDPAHLLVLIGPEGGFSPAEVVLAEKAGAKKVSLGEQILRSETAALTLLTLCQYELGNI